MVLHLQVVLQLTGDNQLPWETSSSSTQIHRSNAMKYSSVLKTLKGPIMQTLSRDPAARPSMAEFATTCRQVIDASDFARSSSSSISQSPSGHPDGTLLGCVHRSVQSVPLPVAVTRLATAVMYLLRVLDTLFGDAATSAMVKCPKLKSCYEM